MIHPVDQSRPTFRVLDTSKWACKHCSVALHLIAGFWGDASAVNPALGEPPRLQGSYFTLPRSTTPSVTIREDLAGALCPKEQGILS
jgi:hypothetical protein